MILLNSYRREINKKMEVQIKNNKLVITHKLTKNEMYKINQGETFKTISIFKKPILVKGFSNVTEFGDYIFTGDYDNVDKEIVLQDAIMLQNEYHLPPFYLFTTREEKTEFGTIGNYHLVNLAILNYPLVKEMIGKIRGDEKYKTMNERSPYRSWVLRISGKNGRKKPKYLGLVGDKSFLENKISLAHLKLLDKLYKIEKINYSNLDGGKLVKINTYETK